jgi:hypothetical protein
MRRFILVVSLVVVGLMLVMTVGGCDRKNPVATNPTTTLNRDSTLTLIFDSPRTVVEVNQYTLEHQLKVLEMRLKRPGYVSGFRLNGQNPSEAATQFAQEHRKFLLFIISRNEPEYVRQRSAAMAELAALSTSSLRVSSITIEGTSVTARDLPSVKLSELPLSPDDPGLTVEPSTIKQKVEPNSVNHPSQMWAPYGGTSEVSKYRSYQRFIFNDVSKFGSSMASYEHETHIFDKNYANQTGYWSSSMPNAYLDCGNNDSVDNFAVGTFTANKLRTYTWYDAYIGLTGQSAPSSTVTIWAQRGTRWGWSCWYVKSDEHAGPLITQGTGSGISWQF